MKRWEILNGTQLKLIMIVLMVCNHVYYMFEFTGAVPLWVDVIGYAVAPVFFYLVLEGFLHTRDRGAYYRRLWLVYAMMAVIQWAMNYHGFMVRADGFRPANGIVANFLVIFVIWSGLEQLEQRHWAKGIAMCVAPILYGVAGRALIGLFPALKEPLVLLHSAVYPNFRWITDGGDSLIAIGVVLYLTRRNKKVQLLSASATGLFCYTVGRFVIRKYLRGMDTTFADSVFDQGVILSLCLLLMFFYNGQRGRGYSRLFYWFYPLHVYVLYAVSGIVYEQLNPGSGQIEAVTIPALGVALTMAGVLFTVQLTGRKKAPLPEKTGQ